ncbi:hypothetical protein [Terasakiispira papahanaumokuakeensis]|nr:hypothetical protein [Terasakiispira papahanaumokuakeensis]
MYAPFLSGSLWMLLIALPLIASLRIGLWLLDTLSPNDQLGVE